ncbi:histidine kinase dimerization/phosphoacceptor domain -containing protein [Sphingomonas morindae]|uniref:histidine kinase n=1 Tax=Sphingomonas morindae TaxID=1541170 RepID=A0ABY4XAV4_9SPHN|nr:histidine kinase dimerization/phosphoacceptor domain -containing protein [Sphingomonas morindae]USI74101.1 GAF domain-containing protein [Sphingomonas morindae]
MQTVSLGIAATGERVDDQLSRRYLALIADVAGRLLAAEQPATMVDELFAMIRDELRLDVFFNYRVEDGRLRLEAHGGLTPEQAEAGAELALGQAVCGCVARDRAPIHVTGVQGSADPLCDFVRDIGLDAYACTPLVYAGELLGTLGFGRRWADRFTQDELSFLHTLCHYVALAKHRLRAEAALRESVQAQERLLAELNHRVRNALQLGVSLVLLEVTGAEAGETAAALRLAAERVQVLAAAHRPLYRHAHPEEVDVESLLRSVLEQALDRAPRIAAEAGLSLPIERAVALALLLHELVLGQTECGLVLGRRRDAGGNHMLRIELHGSRRDGHASTAGGERMLRALTQQLRAVRATEGSVHVLELPLDHG